MSVSESFAKRIQRIMGNSVPNWIPRGTWQGIPYDHIFIDVRNNFIDGCYPVKCCIKGNTTAEDIKYHQGAAHMNSSQVMCISYFKKFFEKPEYEKLLLDIMRRSGLEIAAGDQIKTAIFEYEPDSAERTNFDFYMELVSGIRISFEIKYTEPEFGGISPNKQETDKYDRKWDDIYKKMVEDSPFLNIGKLEFYQNYQVNRNIAFAEAEDYVLFLTPRANDARGIQKGRAYIEGFHNSHIRNLYWEDIVENTFAAVKDYIDLQKYYLNFYGKYIEILELF